MKNAFITGASGHIGSCLVRYLLKDNWTVKCLINNDTRSIDDLDVKKIYVSIFDEHSLSRAMIGCDVVFHLAAIVAQEKVDYAINRYSNEANRLYGVLDRQLEGREYVAGDYSVADIAIFPWTRTYERQHVTIKDYPNVVRWRKTMFARPAVQRGMKVGAEWREDLRSLSDEEWKKLFGA